MSHGSLTIFVKKSGPKQGSARMGTVAFALHDNDGISRLYTFGPVQPPLPEPDPSLFQLLNRTGRCMLTRGELFRSDKPADYYDERYVIDLNQETYRRVHSQLQKLAADGGYYSLPFRNCATVAADIARIAGVDLKRPVQPNSLGRALLMAGLGDS